MKVTLYVPDGDKLRLKVARQHLTKAGRSLSQLFTEAMRAYVGEVPAEKPVAAKKKRP
jgi:hypothetical protein